MDEIIKSHAAILDAYLSRLSLGQIERLLAAHRACWEAQNRESTSGQMRRIKDASTCAEEAIDSILVPDLRYVDARIACHAEMMAKLKP